MNFLDAHAAFQPIILRFQCDRAIKCLACNGWGHIAATCFKSQRSAAQVYIPKKSKGKEKLDSGVDSGPSTKASTVIGPSQQGLPQQTLLGSDHQCELLARQIPEDRGDPQTSSIITLANLILEPVPQPSKGPVSCELTLGGDVQPSDCYPISTQPPDHRSVSLSDQQFPSTSREGHSIANPSAMAFQRADPTPFIPANMHLVNVPGRVAVARAVARSRP